MPVPKPGKNARPGRKLEFIREQNGISRKDLADKLGMTTGALFNLENGFNPIQYKHAKAIGEFFNIDYKSLMDEYTSFCKPGYGKRIQLIRLMAGYTQEEFAELVGTERCTVAVWECEFDERHPEPQKYEKIKECAVSIGIDIYKLIENPDAYKDDYTLFVEGKYGDKIRQIRLANCMTMDEFAKAVGCEKDTLEHWETHVQRPLRKYFPALKEIIKKSGMDLSKINENPRYYGSQYVDFISKDCDKKVLSIRMAYGYTREQLGKLIKCTGEAIGKWERGQSVPDLNYYKVIESVAHRAGITIDQLNDNPELFIDDYKEFCQPGYGSILRKIRKQLGLRQVDFAEAIGVSGASYRNWEVERFIPSRENYNAIKRFAEEEGVKIHEPYRTESLAD